MGTNYYLTNNQCDKCGRKEEDLHIGKSSVGWYFSLRIYPDKNINNLNDWVELFGKDGVVIINEYEDEITPIEMILMITNRGTNFKRHKLGEFCVRNGYGTYDYFNRDFS